jgi:hypothetical protein
LTPRGKYGTINKGSTAVSILFQNPYQKILAGISGRAAASTEKEGLFQNPPDFEKSAQGNRCLMLRNEVFRGFYERACCFMPYGLTRGIAGLCQRRRGDGRKGGFY